MATNDDWPARTVEPALEPDLPICRRRTADWSADERAHLFHDTAARVYRLDRPVAD